MESTQNQSINAVMFKCSDCGKLFMHRRTLKRHEQTHCAANNFVCLTCGKSYSQAYDLERHCRLHRGDRPFHCQVCSRSFSMAHHLTNHMVTHTGVRAFSCLVCHKSFAQTFSLKRHMRLHLRLADKAASEASLEGAQDDGMALLRSLSCLACRKVFSSVQTLQRHHCSYNTDAPQRFVDVPNTARAPALSRARALSRQPRNSVAPDKPYSCTECSKQFAHPYSLKRHRVEHSDNAHVCPTCSKRFGQLYELVRHVKTHQLSVAGSETPSKAAVNCGICCRAFVLPDNVMNELTVLGLGTMSCCQQCLGRFMPTFAVKLNNPSLTGLPQQSLSGQLLPTADAALQ